LLAKNFLCGTYEAINYICFHGHPSGLSYIQIYTHHKQFPV
jgi:hypothetical protein